MDNKKNIAVFFSYPSNGLIDHLKIKELEIFASEFAKVQIVWNSQSFNFLNKSILIEQINKENIDCIIIIGEYPGFGKSFFSELLASAGKDPSQITLIDFQEYFDNQQSFDLYSKSLIESVIIGDESFYKVEVKSKQTNLKETLVVGAGIAGIQASLEIANSKT